MSFLLRGRATARRSITTRSQAQSLVEFALILPVFLLFFAAVLDLGRIAGARIAVSNAAREGVFQAARTPRDFDPAKTCPSDGATNVVYCRITLESSGGVSIAPSDVAVSCLPLSCASGVGNTVTVRITGHFRLLTPLMGAFFGGTQDITFGASATQNVETLPVSATAPMETVSPTPTPTPTATPNPTSTAATTPAPTPTCTLPSAGFTYTTSPANDKAPLSLRVSDTSTSTLCGITSWLWAFGDNTTSNLRNPTAGSAHVYLVAGTYAVTLTVGNAAGTKTSGVIQIVAKT